MSSLTCLHTCHYILSGTCFHHVSQQLLKIISIPHPYLCLLSPSPSILVCIRHPSAACTFPFGFLPWPMDKGQRTVAETGQEGKSSHLPYYCTTCLHEFGHSFPCLPTLPVPAILHTFSVIPALLSLQHATGSSAACMNLNQYGRAVFSYHYMPLFPSCLPACCLWLGRRQTRKGHP